MTNRSSLERKMLSYFGLIAAASLLITMEFVWAIREATPHPMATVGASVAPSSSLEALGRRLETLRGKAVLMCVVQATVTLIVLIMFMRRITGPLQQMVEESKSISDGDLSRTIQVRTRDEIGLIGETINGLTSNIQEIVALSLSTEASVRQPLARLRRRLADDSESGVLLDDVEARLDSFKDIAECFKLLPPPSDLDMEEQP
jgi:methyl-accepting chemotaxis protein